MRQPIRSCQIGVPFTEERLYSSTVIGCGMWLLGTLFDYDWLAPSHLPMLPIFATCAKIHFLNLGEFNSQIFRNKQLLNNELI